MSERLTISIGDGTTKKLRTMAGGERKIGVWLTITAAWLFDQQNVIGGRPLQEFVVVDANVVAGMRGGADGFRAEIDRVSAEIARVSAELEKMQAFVELQKSEFARTLAESQAQEDGGKDDAQQNAKRKAKRDA